MLRIEFVFSLVNEGYEYAEYVLFSHMNIDKQIKERKISKFFLISLRPLLTFYAVFIKVLMRLKE